MPSGALRRPVTRSRPSVPSERQVKMRPLAVLRSSELPWSRMKRCVWVIVRILDGAQLIFLLLLVLEEVRSKAIGILKKDVEAILVLRYLVLT